MTFPASRSRQMLAMDPNSPEKKVIAIQRLAPFAN